MNKDRIAGAATAAKGSVREAVGKITGDTAMEGKGKAETIVGKVQNTAGKAEDDGRGALNK